ncbi:tripartite tricarboxylate transporter substrate binding protein [Xenophilus arseniciresistens]|uniref:Tripartite tricarboxylate transporter substrate binding protein n=1 Tax=Xenophilus arseniciresistens TaxID=1283306 RepID=A0AAE3N5Q0_9BURK|nr:tripartite tricarboxylate transporter substrate binding protein [Xenophilus arseniciresistens]MDA7416050.1 tripartite tricarboxylate transporter substrate binding protein [Xenophilus arseniciresistens]
MKPNRRSFCGSAAAAMALPFVVGQSWAQSASPWPNKALRFISPYPPGGLSDQIARFIADGVSRELGQPVIVDNKPGAGATLGTELAARATPDGYTFLVAPTAAVAVAPWIRKLKFTADDFVPVAKLASSYGLITTFKDAPWAHYGDFIKAAKAAPGKYTFASNGVGSIVHLTGVLLHKQAGIDVVHVPYKGSMESMNDLVGGRVDVMYDPVTMPRVKDGVLKGLASTTRARNPELADVPTLKELGFDLDTRSWFALFAPKGTPAEIVARMSDAAHRTMTAPAARQQLLLSALYPDFEAHEAFGRRVRDDSMFFKELIQKEKIQVDG